jgi:hypothetical protein
MFVTVKRSAVEPPMLVTKDATVIEIRNDKGELYRCLVFMSDAAHLEFSSNDKDFQNCLTNFGIDRKIDPEKLTEEANAYNNRPITSK